MKKRHIIVIFIIAIIFFLLYFPGFSRIQQLKEEKTTLSTKIDDLEQKNKDLKDNIYRLQTDPVYVERVARSKMKRKREGEIIYKFEE